MGWNRTETEPIRQKTEDCRIGSGVAKTDPKPDQTEPVRGVVLTGWVLTGWVLTGWVLTSWVLTG